MGKIIIAIFILLSSCSIAEYPVTYSVTGAASVSYINESEEIVNIDTVESWEITVYRSIGERIGISAKGENEITASVSYLDNSQSITSDKVILLYGYLY